MAKTISINDLAYVQLVTLSAELTRLIGKPVPLGVTVHLALIGFKNRLESPEIRNFFKDELQKINLRDLSEWEMLSDHIMKQICQDSDKERK